MTKADISSINIKGARRTTEDDVDQTKASNVRLRCGDCLHYKGTAHPAMGKPCATLGVTRGATAPTCYTPNVALFRPESARTLHTLFTMVSGFTPQQQRVLMGMLRNASSLSKYGFQFLETVYFATNDRGRAVLADYYRGFVAAPGPGKTLQIVGMGFLNGNKTPAVALLSADSLLTRESFEVERKRLVKQGKLEGLPAKMQQQASQVEYEPPTLDTAEDFLARNAQVSSKKLKKKAGPTTLRIDQAADDAEQQEEESADNL